MTLSVVFCASAIDTNYSPITAICGTLWVCYVSPSEATDALQQYMAEHVLAQQRRKDEVRPGTFSHACRTDSDTQRVWSVHNVTQHVAYLGGRLC